MKKISLVTSIHPDFDKRIYRMAKSIAKAGYSIELICPWKVEKGQKDGIYYKPFVGEVKISKRYMNYKKIWHILSDSDADIFHFHDLDLLPLMTLFQIIKKKKVIYDVHENYAVEMKEKEYIPRFLKPIVSFGVKWTEYICARIIKNLVVVVDSQEDNFKHPDLNLIKVRNFASLDILDNKLDDYYSRNDSVIFIGAQTETNGSLLFLEIAKQVIQHKPNVKFYCIDFFSNEGFRKKFLCRMAEYKIENSVIMLSQVKPYEIMNYINLATIAILPSLNVHSKMMGLPTKTFEYMAGGIPIVSNNHPYPIKYIKNNNIGLVADPDFPSAFVDNVLYLINNKSEADLMGKRANNLFRNKYNWEKEIEKLLAFYEKI